MNPSTITAEARDVLMQLVRSIHQLNYDEYTEKISILGNGTIGEHTRHIIELFQQLLNGYDLGDIDYDHRNRDIRLQENIDFATESIANIIGGLEKEDKGLKITTILNHQEVAIQSNYYRELMYNIEHCVHHQAIQKIGFIHLNKLNLDENFGVAKSTIKYRSQCAQ